MLICYPEPITKYLLIMILGLASDYFFDFKRMFISTKGIENHLYDLHDR